MKYLFLATAICSLQPLFADADAGVLYNCQATTVEASIHSNGLGYFTGDATYGQGTTSFSVDYQWNDYPYWVQSCVVGSNTIVCDGNWNDNSLALFTVNYKETPPTGTLVAPGSLGGQIIPLNCTN